MAALPPAAVTVATMRNSIDRAPDSTATVPRGNGAEPCRTPAPSAQVIGGGPYSPGHRFHPPAQRFELVSAIFMVVFGGESHSHNQPPEDRMHSKICSIEFE